MRIFVDFQAFILQEHGGVSRVLVDLFRHISAHCEGEVTIFGGLNVNRHLAGAARSKHFRVVGFKGPPAAFPQRVTFPFNYVGQYALTACLRPEIIHRSYYRLTPRTRSAATAVTVHDMIHEIFPEGMPKGDPTARRKRQAADEADVVICPSQNTRRDLLAVYRVPEQKVRVVYHGDSIANVIPDDAPAPGYPYLLHVGQRHFAYKNLPIVYAALAESKELSPLRLVLFGGGSLSDDEKVQLRRFGLLKRVHHVSGDDRRLVTLYRHAHALVYPSKYEGFGLPPLEAMGQGCPVVVSRAASLPEVVGDAGLYFQPDDQGGLIEKIKELGDADVRARLRACGIARASLFSWERAARETLAIYGETLDTRRDASKPEEPLTEPRRRRDPHAGVTP